MSDRLADLADRWTYLLDTFLPTEESRPTSPAIRHLQNSLQVLDHNIEIALLKGDTEEAAKDTAQANDIRQAIAILQEHLKP